MRTFAFLLFIVFPISPFAQNVKGFYVDGFSTILGNTAREDSLLRFAENNGFNYLTLYQMHIVNANTPLTNTATAQVFADFVEKAKTQFGIAEIGVAVENFNAVNTIYHVYNQQHAAIQQIDVYNLEFEFWVPSAVDPGGYYCTTYLQPNGYSCDTSGAFAFHKNSLRRIDSLATVDGVKSEVYVGWFNEGQGTQLVETGVDRVLVSTYIPSANYTPAYQYNYAATRLEYLAGSGSPVKVLGLYSAEPDFMQDWAAVNPYFLPYADFVTELSAETASWKDNILPEGIQWFAYADMPKKNMELGFVEATHDEFKIVPNPTNGVFTIYSGEHQEHSIVVIEDLLGKAVVTTRLNATGKSTGACLTAGTYLVRINGTMQRLTVR